MSVTASIIGHLRSLLLQGIFTLIATTYYLVAEYNQPNAYNYWAVLALDIFLVVMWLASFALLASQVSALFAVVNNTYYDSYSDTYYKYASDAITTAWVSCLAAAAGLGGLEL